MNDEAAASSENDSGRDEESVAPTGPSRLMRYDEIALGDRAEVTKRLTESLVDRFAELTGDRNPLHMDDHFAREMGHPRRVVHGLLIASVFSQLVGMQLPGQRCLVLRVDFRFPKPTYVGDELVFEVQVEQKVDAVKTLVLRATARRGDDVVVRGKMDVGVMEGM